MGRSGAGKVILVILAISMAGFNSYSWLSPQIVRAAENSPDPLTDPTIYQLDSGNFEETLQGLSLHGAKVLELQYTSTYSQLASPGSPTLPPGFVLKQRLEAEVEGIWPGIWVRGSFDDDPFFPEYLLRVDMANASVALGDVDTELLSPPLSPTILALTGAQGTLDWGGFTFSLAAGHSQTLTQVDTFTLYPTTRVYQTRLAPILAGTESIRAGNTTLAPRRDYLIDYTLGRIQLLGFWPEAQELIVSYQIPDTSPGKRPLVQGFRGEYQTKHGTLGFSHLSRSEFDAEGLDGYRLPQGDDLSYSSRLNWSALSWEQGTEGMSPHWAAEIWRRTSLPTIPKEQTIEDMEGHTLRQPLSLEITEPHRWSRPEATVGSSLHLSKATGWMPTEGVTRSALELDFTMEGSGARVGTRLSLPAPLNLVAESTLLLTLGLQRALPGIRMEIALVSGTNGSFQQSLTLGNLVGWQDLVLARDDWVKVGIPSWERITAIEIQLASLLPGTSEGQVILGALDVAGVSSATDRWQSLKPRDTVVELHTIPVPSAPWMPPPGNIALSVSIDQLTPVDPTTEALATPQVWGQLLKSFTPTEAETLTFWAHAPDSDVRLTIWLLDSRNEAASPFQFQLSPGWHQYSIALTKPAAQLIGRAITSIALAVTPALGTKSATILLDHWQLQGMQSTEGYMGRFAASIEEGLVHWHLTGSGQTSGFQWDAPGMVENVPHPNHLKLEATVYRPGDKHIDFSVLRQGIATGQTTLQIEADAWNRTILEGQLTLPSGSTSPYPNSNSTPPTGRFRLRTALDSSIWELSAFQQLQRSRLTEPWEARLYQGIALSMEQHLTPGVLRLGSWHLAQGATGQALFADLEWNPLTTLPLSTTFHILRYQPTPTAPAEIGGFGRGETTWQSPDHRWRFVATIDQMVGREAKGAAQGVPSGLPGSETFSPENPILWNPLDEGPRRWQQEAALGWQWHPNQRITVGGRWQREAAKELERHQSLQNTGSLSVNWPWGTTWQSRGAVSWSQRTDSTQSTIQNTEYSLASEGAWGEAWSAGILASQRQTKWQEPSSSRLPYQGERWLLRGNTDYSYAPQGSIGVGLSLSHQTTATLGLITSPQELPYLGMEQEAHGEMAWNSVTLQLPAGEEGPGTYLNAQIRWALAKDALYRMNLGTFTYLPLTAGSSRVDYYGQASVQKEWGALGSGRLELSAGLGSQTAWAIGLGWVKQLLQGQKGLYLNVSLRHVHQLNYQLTDSRLGLEYRF